MIIRNPTRDRYSVIDNRALEDPRLSWKARGVLGYLLTKPDGWRVIVSHLVNQSSDGRFATTAALKELEEFGYITRGDQLHQNDGKFDGVDVEVRECPAGGWPFVETSNGAGDRSRKTASGKTVNGKPRTSKDSGKELLSEPFTHSLASIEIEAVDIEALKAALFDACGIVPTRVTASRRASVARAASDLASVCATPAEVTLAASRFPVLFPNRSLTPSELSRTWPHLLSDQLEASA